MSTPNAKTLEIDPAVYARLAALAEQQGESFEALASRILRDTIDALEQGRAERAEDERRWQNYLQSGKTISFDEMRGKLRHLAAEAASRAESL